MTKFTNKRVAENAIKDFAQKAKLFGLSVRYETQFDKSAYAMSIRSTGTKEYITVEYSPDPDTKPEAERKAIDFALDRLSMGCTVSKLERTGHFLVRYGIVASSQTKVFSFYVEEGEKPKNPKNYKPVKTVAFGTGVEYLHTCANLSQKIRKGVSLGTLNGDNLWISSGGVSFSTKKWRSIWYENVCGYEWDSAWDSWGEE